MSKKWFAIFFALLFSFSFCSAEQLEVHFLDVGQADSELIIVGDHAMLIDGGNPGNSQMIYGYLKQVGVEHLDYVLNTHGDSDHVGGLPAAVVSLDGNIDTVFSPYTKCDKERYVVYINKLKEYGLSVTNPMPGEIYSLGNAEFQILFTGPDECYSNSSMVIRMVYGNTTFLFTGDAPVEDEYKILAKNYNLRSNVLKVGHHGSSSSTSQEFLDAVQPYYAVISCGIDNPYGHPSNSVVDRLRLSGSTIMRTDVNGRIIIVSDGHNLYTFTQYSDIDGYRRPEMIPAEQTLLSTDRIKTAMSPVEYEEQYVLNIRSLKFHLPTCKAVSDMSERNRQYVTDTRENLINKGYSPCGFCHP